MTTAPGAAVLGPAPGLQWVLDAQSVTVVPRRGPTHVLHGLDATIWAWMEGGAHVQLVEFVAQLTGTGPEEAANAVATCLTRWLELGLLIPASGPAADHG